MLCIKSPAEGRYLKREFVTMSIYLLAVWFASWTFKHHPPSGAAVYLLALLPALPIFAAIAILGIYIAEEKDEFLRNVLVQSSLWATAIAMGFATSWGLLQAYDRVVNLSINLPMTWVFIVWCFAFALAQPLVQRRYK
jgi:hypothetical protein